VDVIGSVALLLALFVAGYAFIVGIVGILGDRPLLTRTARNVGIAIFPIVSIAIGSLAYLLLTNNFSMAYVAEHSSTGLPFAYKIAALWAGQAGSLLFWTWLLSIFAFVALLANRKKHPELLPTVAVILAGVEFFFLLLNNFVDSPFQVLGVVGSGGAAQVVTLTNGQGLNPLLQYPEMVLHPPLLYLGYTGFTVPFAFALAAMLRRVPGDQWIHITRRWSIVAWSFLGVGILLGAHWAYAVLGWGGYWAWDPVENASLLPWITGTAFLHSIVIQERRGMMKRWSVWLIFTTFLLSVLGTLLTRSGIVSSVHAFAKSSIGIWLAAFLAIALAVCVWGFWRNRQTLRPRRHLDSLVSRESSFLFATLVLVAACVAVLWGTLLPVFSEWVEGSKLTIGPPFFDKITVPIALLLLLLMGVTPVLAWGRNRFGQLARTLRLSFAAGVIACAAAYLMGFRQIEPLVCFFLGAFAAVTIVSQFVRGGTALASRLRINPFSALGKLSMMDTRRYGGFIVHMGVILLFVGIAGQAFNRDVKKTVQPGEQFTIGPYTLVPQNFDQVQTSNYQGVRASVEVFENGRSVMMLTPERLFFPASQLAETKVAIYSSMARDLYVVYQGNNPSNDRPVIHAYLNPLVHWIWLGGLVMLLGTILALLPNDPIPIGRGGPPPERVARSATAEPEPALVSRGRG
jgi:cytochrome c-type biogenesis protein CcmF